MMDIEKYKEKCNEILEIINSNNEKMHLQLSQDLIQSNKIFIEEILKRLNSVDIILQYENNWFGSVLEFINIIFKMYLQYK